MNVYDFIDSHHTAQRLKSRGYTPDTAECAWLVWQSHNCTLKDKFKAWKEIIDTMPDSAFASKFYPEANVDSVHSFLREYMKLKKRLIDRFHKLERTAVYTYVLYSNEDGKIGEDGPLYSSYKEALTDFRLDLDLDISTALFSKRYIGTPDKRIYLHTNTKEEILDVSETSIITTIQENKTFYDVTWGMSLEYDGILQE